MFATGELYMSEREYKPTERLRDGMSSWRLPDQAGYDSRREASEASGVARPDEVASDCDL